MDSLRIRTYYDYNRSAKQSGHRRPSTLPGVVNWNRGLCRTFSLCPIIGGSRPDVAVVCVLRALYLDSTVALERVEKPHKPSVYENAHIAYFRYRFSRYDVCVWTRRPGWNQFLENRVPSGFLPVETARFAYPVLENLKPKLTNHRQARDRRYDFIREKPNRDLRIVSSCASVESENCRLLPTFCPALGNTVSFCPYNALVFHSTHQPLPYMYAYACDL